MKLQPLNLNYFTKLLENEPNILMMAQAMTVLIDGIKARDSMIATLCKLSDQQAQQTRGAHKALDTIIDTQAKIIVNLGNEKTTTIIEDILSNHE